MSDSPNQNQSQPGRRVQKGSARSSQGRVLTYLVILFAAAFFLLLLAYFMQQRANMETIDGLTQSVNQSVTSIHSLQNLVDANKTLETENGTLKAEVEDLQKSLEQLRKENETLWETADANSQVGQAMDWFWQIDEAFVLGRYKRCQTLIDAMEEQDLVKYLPAESVTDNGRFSPADRYQEIYDKLN